jgi:hypothetical protein
VGEVERLCSGLLWTVCYLGMTLVWGSPLILAVGYAAISLMCSLCYVHNKAAAAKSDEWLTSEGVLLLLGLAGGRQAARARLLTDGR